MEQRSSSARMEQIRRIGYAVALCGLAAGGAVLAQGGGGGAKATRGPVEIQVIASGASLPAPWKCDPNPGAFKICVSEEPVDLTGQPPARSVPWRITTPGWAFVAGTGIVAGNPGWSIQSAGSTNWVVHGQKDGTTFKYTINVTNGTAPPVSWDPRIINN